MTDTDPSEFGDAYTFLGMARTEKLIISHFVGKRDEVSTQAFTKDLRSRLVTIPEISTDGWQSYQTAVGQSFGGSVDHAIIQKNYSRNGRADGPRHDHRYEPPRDDPFVTKQVGHGAPDLNLASTSHIERANLTVRMHVRRFTRLCNGFSKKLENHRAAVSLHVAWYNSCRVHESLRVTTEKWLLDNRPTSPAPRKIPSNPPQSIDEILGSYFRRVELDRCWIDYAGGW